MVNSNKITAIFAVFLLIFSSACVETVVVGSVVAGVGAARTKSVKDSGKDVVIYTKLTADLVKNGLKTSTDSVTATVNEGRVLLTGIISDPKKSKLAQNLAWKISSVKEVIDEIQLIDETEDKQNFFSGVADYFITARAETKLIFDNKVSSRNYKIITVNKNVYILGIADNAAEMKAALSLVSKIRGVKKVVNHIILVDDPRRNES